MKDLLKKYILALLLLNLLFVAQAQKDIQLNLQQADLKAFVETVSKITGKSFVIDPAVKGSVTLLSPDTLDKDSLYDVFLAVLDVHGFEAVTSEAGVVKIIPSLRGGREFVGYNSVTRVYALRQVKANDILPTLKPLIPNSSSVSGDRANNLLIISGEKEDVDRIIDVIASIDRASDSGFDIIKLNNASSADVANTVSSMVKSSDTLIDIKVVSDERTNSVLVKAPKSEKTRIRTLIAHLDMPIERSGNTEVIYLKNANAKDVADVLSNAKDSIEQSSEEVTQTNSSAVDLSSRVDIRADEATNSLIVTAPPATMRNLKQVIQKLDIRRSQVLVEAIIAEINIEDINNLGVQWYGAGGNGTIPVGLIDFSNGASSLLGLGSAYAQYTQDGTFNSSAFSNGATIGVGNDNFGMLVNALSENTDSNILSTPSILVMDNKEAEMIVGENIPYVTGSYTTTSDSSSNPFTTIEREDVGVKLTVTPQINEGDTISLTIYQEVSDILSNDERLGPTTTKRALRTSVLVNNNQVLVLGGLIDNQQRNSEQKVPILGDIPVVGNLFTSNAKSGSKRNLMIFLRPTIIENRNGIDLTTRDKYNQIRSLQISSSVADESAILPALKDDDTLYQSVKAPVYERSRALQR